MKKKPAKAKKVATKKRAPKKKAHPAKKAAPRKKARVAAKKAPPKKKARVGKKTSAKAPGKAATKPVAAAAKRAARSSNPMQRNHMDEETEVLVVYGWPARVNFESGKVSTRLGELTEAPAGTDDVFVVAQDLVYCDGRMETVFGRAGLRVHANDGPAELSLDEVRAIEGATPPLSSCVRERIHALTEGSLPEGPPKWYVVPTGCLATGFVAFGDLVDTDPDAEGGPEIIHGGDMSQDSHKKGVLGEWVANASDWDVTEVDLSKAAHDARIAARPRGRYHVMGRYD